MNYVGDVPRSIFDEQEVFIQNGVSVMAGRRRQAPEKIDRSRPDLFSSFGLERHTHLKARLLFRVQAISVSKSLRKIFTMFVVPFTGSLAITIVKLGMQFAIITVSAAAWRGHRGAGHSKQCRYACGD